MQKLRHTVSAVFVASLAVLLLAGVVFVAGQALALITGQGEWLAALNEGVKVPACIAASVCAIAGFLLSYKTPAKQDHRQQEARTP
ncbi:hypothetical protein ACFUTU_13210 [Arthrobacter sp. NPDC057388]|uniref:hypothetical protein n=1 Tax=Arthrobacter sp. NPDC057388 TaxID=3346116 RepID=UPI0036362C86